MDESANSAAARSKRVKTCYNAPGGQNTAFPHLCEKPQQNATSAQHHRKLPLGHAFGTTSWPKTFTKHFRGLCRPKTFPKHGCRNKHSKTFFCTSLGVVV